MSNACSGYALSQEVIFPDPTHSFEFYPNPGGKYFILNRNDVFHPLSHFFWGFSILSFNPV